MTTNKRIISIDKVAVANVVALTYGILTAVSSVFLLLFDLQRLTYPFGFVLPGFHLNLNLNLLMPRNALGQVVMILGLIVSYTVTGWLSGYLLAAVFNILARGVGGIPASIAEITEVDSAPAPSGTGVDHSQLSS